MKTTFYFIRHGESLGNANGILLGQSNMDLTELGYKQAEATAERLSEVKIDRIYSSDLTRAYNTAIPHARRRNTEVIADKELREVYAGDWDGKSFKEIAEKWPDAFTPEWHKNYGLFCYPNGESNVEIGERFYKAVVRIAGENPGGVVMVVSHAAILRSFWALITGVTPENMGRDVQFPSNASYSIAEYENGKFKAVAFSCDDHLSSVGITKINI